MVDLGGYIIILINHNGKIKLYGSPADNAESLEVGDEILEVNGRTLEDATHSEVIQYIHQCIKSRTICLRVKRKKTGNKMEELDGPNAGRIKDAWVIAVERGARERLQKLSALRRIQPRDITVLYQQISEGAASTSEGATDKDVSSSQITVKLSDKEPGTIAYPTKLSNGTVPKGIAKDLNEKDLKETIKDQKDQKDALEKQLSSLDEPSLLQLVQSSRVGERRASSPFQNGRTEVLIGEPEGGPRSPRGSTSSAIHDSNFLTTPEEKDYPEPICRSRRRSAGGVAEIHLQQNQQQQSQLQENNNSSSRDTKESREGLGPDEMWAPGALGHHRELPVDVPDTLLQQAYPNKVKKGSSPCRNEPRQSRSASDLSLNLKNEALKKTTLSRKRRDPESSPLVSALEKPIMTIELKIENPIQDLNSRDKVNEDDKTIHNLQDNSTKSASPDLKDPLKSSDDEEDDHSQQKESNVDEEDYPFAKEDYPTMLKSCSDDSASPRSSSGRSDSTAPLDSSLPYDVSRIDLGSPCRALVPDIKVTPLFTRSRNSTSFDNPAYGLADLQDLQGFLLRSDEVSDLTRLIDEQVLNRKPQPWKEEITESLKSNPNLESNVNIISVGSTDDLIRVELAGLSSKPKKKQRHQQSSGYSTLRSEASTEFDQVDSFLVVGNKNYREVAVDCPSDFVPVTKSHPVYPPPNKTPANSKHNTLEPKRHSAHFSPRDLEIAHKIELEAANKTSLPPSDNPRETVVLPLELKHDKKVRSRVKSLLVDSLFSLKHNNHKPSLEAYSTTHCSPSKTLSNLRKEAVGESSFLDDDNNDKRQDIISRSFKLYSPRKDKRSYSEENLLSGAFEFPESNDTESTYCLSIENPYLNFNASLKTNTSIRSNASIQTNASHITDASEITDVLKKTDSPNLHPEFLPIDNNTSRESERVITFSTFLGDDSEKISPKKYQKTDELTSFNRERNQNSRNSLKELKKGIPLIVYYTPNREKNLVEEIEEKCPCSAVLSQGSNIFDDSPNTQNQKNSRLSLEYQLCNYSSISQCSNFLEISKLVSKSDIDLSNSMDLSVSKVQSWLSDPHLFSSTVEKQKKGRDSKSVRLHTKTKRKCFDKDAPSIAPSFAPKKSEDLSDTDIKKAGLNGVKPAIPPRDQKRAPARPPKDNLRLSTQNNNVEPICDIVNAEPTQQQLHSIRKYKEQLRRRKDEEEKQEYLNRSLRGSRKLQALESHATSLSGQENLAYSQDEVTTVGRTSVTPSHVPQEVEEPPRPLTYGEVVATLERLQLQLRSISGALGISGSGVEAELEAVRTLLVQRRFATALSTHHALKSRLRSGKVLKTYSEDASTLARDCVEVLEQWQSSTAAKATAAGETIAAAEELTALLTSYEMEGLLLAHDSIISSVDGFQAKSSSSSPSGPPSPSSSLRDSHVADNIRIIRIEKTNEPLGATVRNDGDAVIIGRVVRGGAADKSGLLHEGDEVLEVNGVEMRGKSVNEVCDILAGMQGSLTFLIFPTPVVQTNSNSNKREDNQQIHHVRAHFDYDPEEDPYIPCRELGVSFQKGDVLHVISQEDPNWWQAYREGEEDQTLAGLIPSKAFQHQRESMKQTISGDKSTVRGSKKSSTLLCARRNPKKKKRNKFGANFNDDGYPLYATTTIDDYDSEEVLTYEEVALYYPRANHKRPIVLIGPPNIGRHELRQRLMQDSERFAAAIPHTSRTRKDSEIDGQDYHFISRSQFESDILCRKFVEHGEYEKAYYGTSVEAIRSVVNSGKICVLNLHPQSLKILRSSDLKPYVVFVAPPSLEKLRQKRIKNNENFKEDELKDIIEKAREMEDKYGHLFDMIIINNDTDRAYNQLLTEINSLEREPQWVPASWLQ